jgi:carotenoid cleavage dioxygenase-like enzyme
MNAGGTLCAVVEAGGIPVELDYELASVRRTDFDGTLEAGFTGHPHFDPITVEHHALAYEPFQPVRYISVDRDGRAAMKHDMQRQTTEVHDYGSGRMTAEPVFVRKPGATAEDEGWVLSYGYDPDRDLSDVVILDAQDFAGEPIATIRLPVRVPFGFHGGWAPDKIAVVE